MNDWWWTEGQTRPEKEFSRRVAWYQRGRVFVTETEQGWMIMPGSPSLGQLIWNRTAMRQNAKVFDVGSYTIGM